MMGAQRLEMSSGLAVEKSEMQTGVAGAQRHIFFGKPDHHYLTALVLDSRAHQVRWDGLAATSEWFPSQIHKSQQLGAVI